MLWRLFDATCSFASEQTRLTVSGWMDHHRHRRHHLHRCHRRHHQPYITPKPSSPPTHTPPTHSPPVDMRVKSLKSAVPRRFRLLLVSFSPEVLLLLSPSPPVFALAFSVSVGGPLLGVRLFLSLSLWWVWLGSVGCVSAFPSIFGHCF